MVLLVAQTQHPALGVIARSCHTPEPDGLPVSIVARVVLLRRDACICLTCFTTGTRSAGLRLIRQPRSLYLLVLVRSLEPPYCMLAVAPGS